VPIELTGDQRRLPASSFSAMLGYRRREWSGNRGGHFVLGRQVDPQLHHFQLAAASGEIIGVKLFMQDAAAVIHCTSPGPMVPPLPVESRCSTSPS
jgi:hypothetical protein